MYLGVDQTFFGDVVNFAEILQDIWIKKGNKKNDNENDNNKNTVIIIIIIII